MLKLSIIIPIYNVNKFLNKCIESCLTDDTKDYEIILINDGSTDDSLSICKDYALLYKNIVVINKENGGLSSARNAGIKVAKGKYLFFLDADDFLENKSIDKLLVDSDYDYDMICYDFYKYNNYEKKEIKFQKKEKPENLSERLFSILGDRKNANWSAWGKLFLRDFINSNSLLFDESNYGSEDLDFVFRCILVAQKSVFKNEFIVYYRTDNMTSITKKINIKTITCLLKVMINIEKVISQVDISDDVKKLFYSIFSDWYIFCLIRYNDFNKKQKIEISKLLNENKAYLKKAHTKESKICRIILFLCGKKITSCILKKIKNRRKVI